METERILEALEGAGVGVCVADRGNRILRWSPGAENLLGHGSSQVEGLTCMQLLAGIVDDGGPSQGREYPHLECARAGVAPAPFALRVRDAAGQLREVQVAPLSLQADGQTGPLTIYVFDEKAPAGGLSREPI